MRKTQFIEQLRTVACATADAVLASVGHSTKSCPYIAKWLAFYQNSSSQHLESALLKYTPEARQARTAREYISIVTRHVERATLVWAKTGKITGVPQEMQAELAGGGGGFLGAVAGFASSGFGSALLGFLGGGKREDGGGAGSVQRKARDGGEAGTHDAAAVKAQLGSGHALDSRVQSRMSSAFSYDFSSVRVHTDSRAAGLSDDLSARAFTIGSDVAFATGEYQPGTLIGDVLIAHELAHVVQQGGATASEPLMKGEGEYNALEQDADRSAVGVVLSLHRNTRQGLTNLLRNSVPRLRSGLGLQRCSKSKKEPAPGPKETPAPSAPSVPATTCPRETITMGGAECGERYGAIATYCYEGTTNWWFKEHVENAPGTPCQPGEIKQETNPGQAPRNDGCIRDFIFDTNGPPSAVAPCTDKTFQTVFAGPTKDEVEQCSYHHEQNIQITAAPDKKSGKVITNAGAAPTECDWTV